RAFDNSSYAIYSNNGTVNSDISNTIDIYGNLFSDNDGAISLAFNNASSFAGAASLTERGVIYLSFDNSKWSVSGNSTISNLELLNGAAVDLNSSSDFIALHTDNILGDTGEFGIKVDAVNSLSDKVIINNSSTGVYNVKFDDRTTGGYVSNGSLSLSIIEYANHSNGNYNASFNGQVELGALVYTLTYDNQSEIYYIGDAAFGGSNNSGGGNGTTPTPQQSSSANTSVGFAMVNYAINNINTQTILQRMGELRQSNEQRDIMGDMWIRTYAGKLGSFDDNKRLDGVKYYGLQMGIDKMTNINNAKVYTGFSAGYARADANYEKGDSQTTLYDFGVYALYYDESDFYVDTLAKYKKNKNNFNAVTINNNSVSGDGDSNSVSLSAEVGKRYGLTNNIYLEPQVELSYTNQGSLSIKSSNGLKTEIDKYNSYLLRGSIIAGYKLKDTVNLYLKTGFIRELDGKSSYMFNADENSKKEYKPNKNTFDNALGITINSSAHNIYAEGAYQKGDEFDNVRANVGYRYRF
ncbi:MAG: autotransporter outer membrane beta-barrel domain-containing protein, partial [Campylobacteraceae bacterium]|nr:autotransporter outer membrane beta-barrel domain-containing protein [Campylobacteraceae bacterium]